jgi:tRNA G10  N-methylase Trm11
MLDDILDFGCLTLVDGGRLSMWMPTANDEDLELAIPQHQALRLVACCVQDFNKCTSLFSQFLVMAKNSKDGCGGSGWERVMRDKRCGMMEGTTR